MSVKISFMKPGTMGTINAIGMGACRACETLTVPDTTALVAQGGEIAVIVSTEANTVIAAHGLTPDAAAEVATAATSAGYAIPAGVIVAVAVHAGDKINIKAFA